MAYTIKEVSEKTGVLSSTLRYWARQGLFPFVEKHSNTRYFSQKDLDWVLIVHCLRQTGLSVEKIKEYIDLCIVGDKTIYQRYEIIKTQKAHLETIIDEYNQALEKIERKVEYYENAILKQEADTCNPKNSNMSKHYDNPQNRNYKPLNERVAKELSK